MRINLKLEFTNTESVMDFAEALKRLVGLEEYQDWNHELTEIRELLEKAARGLGWRAGAGEERCKSA